MNKTRLILKGTVKLDGSEDLYLIFLADENNTRQLTMTCDHHVNYELGLRLTLQPVVNRCLPEALVQMLRYASNDRYEVLFFGVLKVSTTVCSSIATRSTPLPCVPATVCCCR